MKLIMIFSVILFAFNISGCEKSGQILSEGEEYANLDLNSDGKVDVFYEYENDGYYELVDRNFDQKVDESHWYDLDSRIIASKIDEDFDGVLETKRGCSKFCVSQSAL